MGITWQYLSDFKEGKRRKKYERERERESWEIFEPSKTL
jgi:hypothetical protein